MKQLDLEGLEASGLKPIVIDENFDFNSLNGLFAKPPTMWTLPFTNPFQAIRAAALQNGTPGDFQRAIEVFVESTDWSNFDRIDYVDDLLQEIAGRTNIVVQYLNNDNPVSEYRAAYDL